MSAKSLVFLLNLIGLRFASACLATAHQKSYVHSLLRFRHLKQHHLVEWMWLHVYRTRQCRAWIVCVWKQLTGRVMWVWFVNRMRVFCVEESIVCLCLDCVMLWMLFSPGVLCLEICVDSDTTRFSEVALDLEGSVASGHQLWIVLYNNYIREKLAFLERLALT